MQLIRQMPSVITGEADVALTHPAADATRSALEVANSIQAALRASGYRGLEELECRIASGSLALVGTVPSYYLKQVAQSIAARLTRDWPLSIDLTVVAPSNTQAASGSLPIQEE